MTFMKTFALAFLLVLLWSFLTLMGWMATAMVALVVGGAYALIVMTIRNKIRRDREIEEIIDRAAMHNVVMATRWEGK